MEDHVGFVRKVLGIVAAQMALTFLFAVAASVSMPIGNFFRNPSVLIFSAVGLISGVCYLMINKEARREVPKNYILLGLVTVCEAAIIASISADLKVASVFTAIMALCVVTGCLWLAALYTSTRANMQQNLIKAVIASCILDLCLVVIYVFILKPKD